MDRIPPQEIHAALIAKATYLVRRGGLRYQLIAKATYLVRHGGLRFRLLQDLRLSVFSEA